MKASIFLLCILSIPSYAASVCKGNYKGYAFVDKPIKDAEECKSEILTELFAKYKHGAVCLIEKEIQVSWYHGEAPEKLEEKSFSCQTFRDLLEAEGSLVSINIINDGLKSAEPKVDCEPVPLITEMVPKIEENPKLGIQFKDEKELKETLKELKKKGAKIDVSEVFDKLKNGSFSMRLLNDNNFAKLGTKGSGSDRGLTHGMNLKFEHNVKDGKYTMLIEYDTSLYTSYTNPSDPNYTHVGGVTHVDQNFIEENIAKVVLKKVKSDNAFYWTAGGGFHELNKDDPNRSSLISSIKQQENFHKWFIQMQQKGDPSKRVTTKIYDNIAQEGSERSVMVEGSIGGRIATKPFGTPDVKVFVDAEIGGRLTGVKGASYLESKVSANADLRLVGNLSARGTYEKSARLYTTGQMTSDNTIAVTVGTRAVQVGIKLVDQDKGRLPAYLNPLPKDFPDRKYYSPAPSRTFQMTAKVLW